MKLTNLLRLPLSVLCLAIVFPVSVLADDWRAIDPADLKLKSPVVETPTLKDCFGK